ncbi:hypothetical protein FOZ62_021383 [Perkinsus olseni]|uniref:Uncharacterized protein n=1 Tax=Perkinsus olseni TaxID=32597 RepID=A0A7J6RUJ4_PEROL|nr:hypothetical protein FOZ62_021383 [Perkinsus olseni]
MTVPRVWYSLASFVAVAAYDMTADFALDVHDSIKEKFSEAARESMLEVQKHLREVLSPLHHMVIPAPVTSGDPVCVELKDAEGDVILTQSAQIDYCEPYGTDMSFVVKIGSVTKTLNLPPFIDPTGGSITVPRFFSHLYNGTDCDVSKKLDGGLAGITEVISVHVEKDVCPGDDPAVLWPAVKTAKPKESVPKQKAESAEPEKEEAKPKKEAEPEKEEVKFKKEAEPEKEEVKPKEAEPEKEEVKPKKEEAKPKKEEAEPKEEEVEPKTEAEPEKEEVKPEKEEVKPEKEEVKPEKEEAELEEVASTEEESKPESELPEPKTEVEAEKSVDEKADDEDPETGKFSAVEEATVAPTIQSAVVPIMMA